MTRAGRNSKRRSPVRQPSGYLGDGGGVPPRSPRLTRRLPPSRSSVTPNGRPPSSRNYVVNASRQSTDTPNRALQDSNGDLLRERRSEATTTVSSGRWSRSASQAIVACTASLSRRAKLMAGQAFQDERHTATLPHPRVHGDCTTRSDRSISSHHSPWTLVAGEVTLGCRKKGNHLSRNRPIASRWGSPFFWPARDMRYELSLFIPLLGACGPSGPASTATSRWTACPGPRKGQSPTGPRQAIGSRS